MTSTTTVPAAPARPELADILADDLRRLMPGCAVSASAYPGGAYAAKAIHRTTGRQLVIHVDADEWAIYLGAGASHSGRSAYGFDSAILHHYRHELDFTPEHGPGTAWDYAQREVTAR